MKPLTRSLAGLLLTAHAVAFAQTGGLTQAPQAFRDIFNTVIAPIIAILAVISLVVVGVQCWRGRMEYESAISWGIGALIIGGAVAIVSLFGLDRLSL